MLEKILYSTGPVIVVLLGEHFILKYFYGKKSSIERLLGSVSDSAKSDWTMAWFYYVFYKFSVIRPAISLITIPGLAFLALKWLKSHLSWSGLFTQIVPDNPALQIAIWLVLFDGSHYVAHVLMHNSPMLWRFHRLHHAATEFTILNGIRTSLSEHFLNKFFAFFILWVLLGLPKPEIIFIVIFIRRAIDLIQHSDLPWDYGKIGYVLVSPRYLRFHHSNRPVDYNSNYGDIFSFWDYLFGTTSKRYQHSPSVADVCDLGLETSKESSLFNRWSTVLFQETITLYVWNKLRKPRNP